MSAIWQTIVGACAALPGGFGAAWWQTSRADKVAQKIHRAERQEESLIALSGKVNAAQIELQRVAIASAMNPQL